jgi:1D-myo-inositol-tetrakisphosphate 5-kinase/inositol-polyphosphate multikinase
MLESTLDTSTLKAFGNAAAGHDGVLSDESGALVIKPCTQDEVNFYESVTKDHPDLAPYLPTFMGTLQVSANQNPPEEVLEKGFIKTEHGIERLHGRKLETELHIVLENLTHGFKKPNVLDLKLGKQLWDGKAKPEKRARLDKVAEETTSGSLGFRIAGMRTFKGNVAPEPEGDVAQYVEKVHEGGYWVFNKMYGRAFSADNILEGFEAFVLPGGESQDEVDRAKEIITYFLDEVKGAQKAFESKESRMYSASILLVYEGDIDAYQESKKILSEAAAAEDDEDDEVDVDKLPKLAAVKLIDFAHATWTPGQGPDENAIRGMRSTVKVLEDLLQKVEQGSTS